MVTMTTAAAAVSADASSLTTVLLGVGTVFFGLVCLVVIIELMHAIVARVAPTEQPKAQAPVAPAEAEESNMDHGTLVALCSAAIAEQLGKDVDAIRIHSIKKL